VNHDEIRALTGEYATGKMSDAGRKMLFEAALEDQDLFEELAGEHALKQLLDQQGVRARLVASLTSVPPGKRKIWYWAAASATTVLATVVLIVVHISHPQVREVAEVRPRAPGSPLLPATVDATAASPEPPRRSVTLPKTIIRQALPQSEQPPERKRDVVTLPALPEAAAAPTSPPPSPAASPATGVEPQTQRLAVPSPITAFRAAPQTVTLAQPRFAFSYEVTTERTLRVTTETRGFLAVGVNAPGESPRTLSDNRPAQPGVAAEFSIPPDASIAYIVFSARQNATKDFPAGLGGAFDPASGSKVDPNPSPDSQLTARIALPPP
jgi:hypothetical protein